MTERKILLTPRDPWRSLAARVAAVHNLLFSCHRDRRFANMRKTYSRRFLLPFCLLSISFLIYTTVLQSNRNNIPSLIYYPQAKCIDPLTAPVIQSTAIPPHYLIIPYREFALRTSIACRAFKLDSPKRDTSAFHPKYSKHLRGEFRYALPYANITFEDVENFYAESAANQTGEHLTITTPFVENMTFENIPYKFENGMWYPVGVTSIQRTAILVPLQGRQFNAKAFLLNMHRFLRLQQLTYTIFLIEQISPVDDRFNKGRLYNTAVRYLTKQSLNITCIVLHDVDLIPEQDGNFYTCESKNPKHTTSRVRQLGSKRGYTRYYEFLIGGVLLLTYDMYKTLNGFSNLYWGWGGEDDDLALRFVQQKMCVVRPDFDLAVYIGLPHPRGRRNEARFNLLAWATVRFPTDGYAQIEKLTEIVDIRQTSTVTHLKVNVESDKHLDDPSPEKAILSSFNISKNTPTKSANKDNIKAAMIKKS